MSSLGVASLSVSSQARYNLVPPTYADGTQTELQADENGNLMVTGENKAPLATEATLASILAAVDGLEGFTDGLETLLGTTNTLLTTMNGYVDGLEGYTDGIETLIGSTNTLLTTMNGYVDQLEGYTDGIETLIGSTNTLITTLNGYVDQLEGYFDGVETLLTSIDDGIPAALGQTTMAASMPVTIASDQSTLAVGGNAAAAAADSGNPVKVGGKYNSTLPTYTDGQRGDLQLDARGRVRTQPEQPTPNSAGSFAQADISGATTLTKPANAVGFVLEASSDNSASMRWRADGTAATSSTGMKLEPGRDTGFIPMARDISICPESGTQQYQIQWVLSA